MPHEPRNPFAVKVADGQRTDPSQAEALLWTTLRNRGLGVKFRRQVPLGPYVADFVCFERKLIVESDGPLHDAVHDARRDAYLASQGFRVVRLPDDLVRGATELAAQRIRDALADR